MRTQALIIDGPHKGQTWDSSDQGYMTSPSLPEMEAYVEAGLSAESRAVKIEPPALYERRVVCFSGKLGTRRYYIFTCESKSKELDLKKIKEMIEEYEPEPYWYEPFGVVNRW